MNNHMDNPVEYYFENFTGSMNQVQITGNTYTFSYPCPTLRFCKPYQIGLKKGKYKIELWGSQGGDCRDINTYPIVPNTGGKGAYVSGELIIKNYLSFFLYIGAKGEDQASITPGVVSYGGWNFGGDGGLDTMDNDYPESGAGGGGGVDIRLIYADLESNNSYLINESIKSRIMVAGSGGGSISHSVIQRTPSNNIYTYGNPGGDFQAVSNYKYTQGGTQILGELGRGGQGYSDQTFYGCASGGGGAGYRGGYQFIPHPAPEEITHGGPGGSSYVSGHPDCISPLGGTIHHSGIKFLNPIMIPGNQTMVQPDGTNQVGHSGSGVAKITILKYIEFTCNQKCVNLNNLFYLVFILM